ncbi:MAG TPA: low temperature requirement protein A [Myxococcota bacterium]|nr:low temperature requirement protein A [Myxococcota bacterium]
MPSRILHAPVFHSAREGGDRRVGWLELFYDLVYVAALLQLGRALTDASSAWSGALFVALVVPIWYTWTGFAFFSNRFLVDDLPHRLMVFLQMFFVAGTAVALPRVFDGDFAAWAAFYGGARGLLAGLWWRAWRTADRGAEIARLYALGVALGAVVWVVAALLPGAWGLAGLLGAMAVDLALPFAPAARAAIAREPPDVVHLADRYGTLTLIVLGESFVEVLGTLTDLGAGASVAAPGALVLLVTFSLWWLYFDEVAGGRVIDHPLAAWVWLYAHLPLTVALAGAGVSIRFALLVPQDGAPTPMLRALLAGSVGLALLSVAVIGATLDRQGELFARPVRVKIRVGAAACVLLVGAVGGHMPSFVFVGLVSVVAVAQVVLDLLLVPTQERVRHDRRAAFTPRGEALVPAAPPRRRLSVEDTVRRGVPDALRSDLYFFLMDGGWTRLMGVLVLSFLAINAVFGVLYLLEPGGITNMHAGSFLEAFSFSVQTMATIGYGYMAPTTSYTNVLVVTESVFGICMTALFTGLLFAKASRATSSVLFSEPLLITQRDGKPTLMFRVANGRGNEVVEASMRVCALIESPSSDGPRMRRMYDLDLVRNNSPLFRMSWTVMHPIDERSALFGLTAENVEDRVVGVICVMTAFDATYGSTTHARHMYQPEDFRFDHHFVDMIETLADGRLAIDLSLIHATRPVAP